MTLPKIRKTKQKENKKILGISINERPELIDNREEFSNFEIDTVYGKGEGEGTCLLTLTERKTRKDIVVSIDFKDRESVTYALNKIGCILNRLYTKSGAWKNSSPGFQFLYTKRQISNIIKV